MRYLSIFCGSRELGHAEAIYFATHDRVDGAILFNQRLLISAVCLLLGVSTHLGNELVVGSCFVSSRRSSLPLINFL